MQKSEMTKVDIEWCCDLCGYDRNPQAVESCDMCGLMPNEDMPITQYLQELDIKVNDQR